MREGMLRGLATVTRRFHPRGIERVLRLLHHPQAIGRPGAAKPIESVVRLPNGYRLRTSTASFMEWIVFFKGDYEPPITDLIQEHLGNGEVAIDVGANVGIHTLTMSRAVATGIVIACEPHPGIRARLLDNLSLNGVRNVRVESCAVSSEHGEALLYIPRKDVSNQMVASLCEGSDPTLEAEPLRVATRTIDELTDGVSGRVGLIKVDVEGFEGAVLRGANKVLARDHPVLIFEYTAEKWTASGFDLPTVLDDLRSLGYRHFQEIASRLRPLTFPCAAYANIVAFA